MIESHAVLMFWPSSAHARVRGSGVIASSHRLMKLLWTMVCETLVLGQNHDHGQTGQQEINGKVLGVGAFRAGRRAR